MHRLIDEGSLDYQRNKLISFLPGMGRLPLREGCRPGRRKLTKLDRLGGPGEPLGGVKEAF